MVAYPGFLRSRRIREQDPLKQGLKLRDSGINMTAPEKIREQDPLKQGLKLSDFDIFSMYRLTFESKIH